MKHKCLLCFGTLILLVSIYFTGCIDTETSHHTPNISSWLAKKDAIIASEKPYDMVMTGWFTPEEALQLKSQNPNVLLLAGLSLNWIWENEEWIAFLETVASYDHDGPLKLTEQMYLKTPQGEKCAFGWQSDEWGHEEIYAMDPRDPDWVELITSFYFNVLDQPQHDGVIVDMLSEKQWWCSEAISDEEWFSATQTIMAEIQQYNTNEKLIICNSGCYYEDIDLYHDFFDGFLLENFMGDQCGSTYEEGMHAAETGKIVIYAIDTDDTNVQDMNKMRLGLTLSLLYDTTYFTYDVGPRDHGDAWWFTEYDADIGGAEGVYYQQDTAYFRSYEHGLVVSAPYSAVTVSFTQPHTDVSTGITGIEFVVPEGDGRIFLIK